MLIAKEKREHDKFMIIHLNFHAFLAGKERDGATRRKAITNTSSTSLEELYWGFMGRWGGGKKHSTGMNHGEEEMLSSLPSVVVAFRSGMGMKWAGRGF